MYYHFTIEINYFRGDLTDKLAKTQRAEAIAIRMHEWSAKVRLQIYRGGEPWVSVESRVSRHVRDGEYL